MAAGKTTSRRESVRLEFVGFTSYGDTFLEMFCEELSTCAKNDPTALSLPLEDFLRRVATFSNLRTGSLSFDSYASVIYESSRVTTNARGLLINAAAEEQESRKRFLQALKWQSFMRKQVTFTYDGESVSRVALTNKIFSWGFRALTPDGYRNFSWTKVDLLNFKRESPLNRLVVYATSNRVGPLTTVNLQTKHTHYGVRKLLALNGKVFAYYSIKGQS